MQINIYFTLFLVLFAYVCITDPNVLEWINIKLQHAIVNLQLQWIKLTWKFKKF